MDGNGRWASRRAMPRHVGHKAGVKAVRAIVEGCARRGVEALTAANPNLTLYIALSYGGRWDIAQAAQRLAERVRAGTLEPAAIDEQALGRELALAEAPEPDLFIRTGGEQRLSNFLLWNLAYTELYFCGTLWPDFDDEELERAFRYFASRQRRFGLTGEQVAGV